MTPERFRECLGLLRWSQRGMAEALKCDDRLVRRWAAGDADIPISVAAWLETLAQVHAAAPPPQGWRRKYNLSSNFEIGKNMSAQTVDPHAAASGTNGVLLALIQLLVQRNLISDDDVRGVVMKAANDMSQDGPPGMAAGKFVLEHIAPVLLSGK